MYQQTPSNEPNDRHQRSLMLIAKFDRLSFSRKLSAKSHTRDLPSAEIELCRGRPSPIRPFVDHAGGAGSRNLSGDRKLVANI